MSLKDILDSYLYEFRIRYAGKYYGKYRAVVRDNQDPSGIGRIKVQVPALFGGATSAWCWPASPMGGNSPDAPHGAAFIPEIGDMVWVELEEGNTQKPPVWSGGPWSTESVPDHARAFPDEADNNPVKGHPLGVIPESSFDATETGKVRLIQMPSGSRIELDDTEGSERVQIFHASGAHLEILKDGTINLGATENLRLQASAGLLQVFAAMAWEQIVNGMVSMTVEGDWQQTVGGSYRCEVAGDYRVKASTITMEMEGDTQNTFAGSLTELVLGKEQRTVANQSSTMVGTDWFMQAAGGCSVVAQNSATNGGLPTDLGLDLTAMNSRSVVQSTDPTGLLTRAGVECNGGIPVPYISIDASGPNPGPGTSFIYLGSLLPVPPIDPIPKGLALSTLMQTVLALIDGHIHTCAAPGAPTTPPIPSAPITGAFTGAWTSGVAATLSLKAFVE